MSSLNNDEVHADNNSLLLVYNVENAFLGTKPWNIEQMCSGEVLLDDITMQFKSGPGFGQI